VEVSLLTDLLGRFQFHSTTVDMSVLQEVFTKYGSSARHCYTLASREQRRTLWEEQIPVLLWGIPNISQFAADIATDLMHYASSIEEIIGWIEQLDTTSAILIPSRHLFGPDVMMRCRTSSSNRYVLRMGQFKSFTIGNKESLDSATVPEALTSLHPAH
jgi:hypothetical protein